MILNNLSSLAVNPDGTGKHAKYKVTTRRVRNTNMTKPTGINTVNIINSIIQTAL